MARVIRFDPSYQPSDLPWDRFPRFDEVGAQIEVRSSREADGRYLIGATIADIDPNSRLRLMEWCYVVCSHERLRGHRPSAPPLPESEAIVVSLDDYREGPILARPSIPALRQA